MKPREFVPAVIKLYYKGRGAVCGWVIKSEETQTCTQYILNKKLSSIYLIELREVYLRHLATNLNQSDGMLDKCLKEYEKELNKVLAQLT